MIEKSKKIHVDQTVVRILYFKYKEYLFPLISFLLALGIFMYITLPQLQNFFDIQNQENVNRQTIADLTKNINTLSQYPPAQLDDLSSTASQALPKDKNFEAVLDAISNAASMANVSLADYSFQVGDLQGSLHQQGPLAIQISLAITGNIYDAQRFTSALQKQLPIAEVTELGLRTTSVGVGASFYYAPYALPIFNPDNPLPSFTKQGEDLLSRLKDGANNLPSSVSSASAQ